MDKYEFNIKLEQIKKLAAKKEYKQAADIAKEMNWNKIKDWSTLATIINVQEAAGDYEEARDMAILAYNRNLGGRKLIYKLTEFFIKVDDFENAEDFYIGPGSDSPYKNSALPYDRAPFAKKTDQARVCSSRRMEPSSITKPRAAGIDPKVPSGAQAQMPSIAPSANEKTITK